MGATEAKMATERGATVILSDIIEDQLEATADSLDSAFSRLDVTSKDDWEKTISQILDDHGRIDGLVNNVGILFRNIV